MSRWKGILLAAAPIAVLLIFAAGARLLPSSSEEDEPVDTKPRRPSPSRVKGKRAEVTPTAVPMPVDAKTQAILEKVIAAQLSAFSEKDFALALSYSTHEFRNGSTPEAFQKMVQGDYPEMLEYESLRFAVARRAAQTAMIPIYLKMENGTEVGYLYVLNQEADSRETTRRGRKPAEKSGELNGTGERWYVGFVSRLNPGGYPGLGDGEAGRVTDPREL